VHLTVDVHVDLIKVLLSLSKAAHPADPLPADVGREQRPKPVPPVPHCLVANVDKALKQQVFHVPQDQREPDVHHDH
jgi:hypothetical protein